MQTLTITRPDDWHLHLRDGPAMASVLADTARRFGLQVSEHRDDRLDPVRSTRAAARYLRLLHDRYGDWPLALAAYNAGEGRIDRALLHHPGATLWDLADGHQVPRMSFDYVSRFLAVVRIVDDSPRDC